MTSNYIVFLYLHCVLLLLQLKDRLEICEEHLEKGGLALDLPRAKQALAHHEDQMKDIENAAMRTFCRGEELIDYLKLSEIELRVKDPLTLENIDAQTHIHNLLEVLHRKRRDLRDLAEERKIKLEQNLLLRQLESDAKQVRELLNIYFLLTIRAMRKHQGCKNLVTGHNQRGRQCEVGFMFCCKERGWLIFTPCKFL